MSDGEKPIFFGGLPPRGATAVAEKPATQQTDTSLKSTPEGRLNVLAVVALVGSFFISLVGIVCGILALRQIKHTGDRGRGLAIAGTVIGFVGLAIWVAMIGVLMVGGPMLVASVAGVGTSPNVIAQPAHVSASESAAAKAAIASGGGAIPGHILSGEFCAAMKSYEGLMKGSASTDMTPQLLAGMEKLASVKSPNQKTYQAYVEMMKNPTGPLALDETQHVAADLAKAMQVDITTCM